jgi:hypothetical protein
MQEKSTIILMMIIRSTSITAEVDMMRREDQVKVRIGIHHRNSMTPGNLLNQKNEIFISLRCQKRSRRSVPGFHTLQTRKWKINESTHPLILPVASRHLHRDMEKKNTGRKKTEENPRPVVVVATSLLEYYLVMKLAVKYRVKILMVSPKNFPFSTTL